MRVSSQRGALAVIAIAQLLALSLWFSASAVSDQLEVAWSLSSGSVIWLTLMVQIGFVVGALGSSLLNLADRIPARRLFIVSAFIGASANLVLVTAGPDDAAIALGIRFITGLTLAGVYPSGMKAIAGWFRDRRGSALGVLIGALTVGSAVPHLVRGVGLDWQTVIATASALAALGTILMVVVDDGPFEVPTSPFSWSHVRDIVAQPRYRLATLGYLGHMWELYAAWTWIAAWVAASDSGLDPSLAAFGMIAVGAVGAWWAGIVSDRSGRAWAAGISMVVSGSAAAVTVLVFGAPGWIVVPVLAVWGISIVADSAQFSTMVTEVVPGSQRGTALTLQTAAGFSLTLVTIWLVPTIAEATSWQWAFLVLVPGPIIGTWAMVRFASMGASESGSGASPAADRGATA